MATIPSPISGAYFDDAKFDDFANGWDVDIHTYLIINKIRRAERTTTGVGQRIDIARAERTATAVAQRVDE